MSVLGTHFTAGIISSIYEEKSLITSKNPRDHMPCLEMPVFSGKAPGQILLKYLIKCTMRLKPCIILKPCNFLSVTLLVINIILSGSKKSSSPLAHLHNNPTPRIVVTHLPWDFLPSRVREGKIKVGQCVISLSAIIEQIPDKTVGGELTVKSNPPLPYYICYRIIYAILYYIVVPNYIEFYSIILYRFTL